MSPINVFRRRLRQARSRLRNPQATLAQILGRVNNAKESQPSTGLIDSRKVHHFSHLIGREQQLGHRWFFGKRRCE